MIRNGVVFGKFLWKNQRRSHKLVIMGLTITALGIYQTGKIALPLLRAGYKMVRAQIADSKEPGEVESAVQNILEVRIKALVDGKLASLSEKQLEATDDALVRFTGLVLQSLVKEALTQSEFTEVKDKLTAGLPELPRCWGMFVAQGIPGMQPLVEKDFLLALQAAHDGSETSPMVEPALLATFFTQWFQHGVSDVLWKQGWQQKLAEVVCPWLTAALVDSLITDHPVALTAFRESMLLFQTEHSVKLGAIDKRTKEIAKKQKSEGRKSTRRHKELKSGISKVEAMLVEQTAPGRLAAYKRALLAAFRPYQELAIDNFAAAEQAAPDIWDIFVHPACSENHLRPEEMDAAQRETPPRNLAVELLPLLAREDHRRTVLLGDPGMGKSTLIQALIAHLASGRALAGAPALTGLLPVPLILRDLVPLLPQDQVESWSWDALLDAFLCHYQRDEAALKLCDAFKDHLAEFRQHLHTDPKVFFLIDGLDEIGDLVKRRKIVQCIQDGIRMVSKKAHWLITSRVIGYEEATIHLIGYWCPTYDYYAPSTASEILSSSRADTARLSEAVEKWSGYVVPGFQPNVNTIDDWKRQWLPAADLERIEEISLLKRADSHLARPGVYCALPIAQCLYLAPFDNRRQDAFTKHWFQHRHSTDYSKELMREVRAHHHDGVRIISRVPNLLCLMNILKRSGKPLPDGRAALYDEIVKAYLGGIDAAYRLRPVLGNTCPFDAAQRRFLLALLGAHMQQQRVSGGGEQRAEGKEFQTGEQGESEGKILISKGEIATLLVPVIERLVAEGRVQSDHTAQELLDELLQHIASRSGLLIPRSSDELGDTLFGFTHLSFMEFFAAEWLGMEFDRQRNRIVRQSLAREEGQELNEDDLDREFPPRGPVQHSRESFQDLPTLPAWHEPLIFLLETRKADASTLLRWLFPPLHATNKGPRTRDEEPTTPFLPFDSVRLAVKLAQDSEIPITASMRRHWWRSLWGAFLQWPLDPFEPNDSKRWNIAPDLLGPVETQVEVIEELVGACREYCERCSSDRQCAIQLIGCKTLTSSALQGLADLDELHTLNLESCTGLNNTTGLKKLNQLKRLDLSECTGLIDPTAFHELIELPNLVQLALVRCTGLGHTSMLAGMQHLQKLWLSGCTGLKGAAAFQGLARLAGLQELYLNGCTGLEDTSVLAGLHQLEKLWLSACTGLRGAAAFQGLVGLVELQELSLRGCTGLEVGTLRALRKALPASCKIMGPDGEFVKRES